MLKHREPQSSLYTKANVLKIGFTTSGGFVNPARLLDFVQSVPPDSVGGVIVSGEGLDTLELCSGLMEVTNNQGLFIHRSFDSVGVERGNPNGGDEWRWHDPQYFRDSFKNEGFPQVVRYVVNELSWRDKDDLKVALKHQTDTMRLMREAGFTGVFSNWAAGRTPPVQWIEEGLMDEYLIAASAYDQYIGQHDYNSFSVHLGFGTSTPGDVLDSVKMQPENWPDVKTLPALFDYFDQNFYCFNSDRFIRRAKELKARGLLHTMPRIAITEGIHDRHDGLAEFTTALTKIWGTSGYSTMRGPRSYTDWWNAIWDEPFEESYIRELGWYLRRWDHAEYQPELVSLFGWFNQGSWEREGFHIPGAPGNPFLPRLTTYIHSRKSPPPDPAPPPVDIPPNPPAESPDDVYDMRDYLRGTHTYRLRNPSGFEFLQTMLTDARWYQVKNEHIEEMWANDLIVMRGVDTSPGEGRVYEQWFEDQRGAPWIPTMVWVGMVYERRPEVRWYDENRNPIGTPEVAVTSIRVKAHHAVYEFMSGIRLPDVLELEWIVGGQVEETYLYARNYGLVGWIGKNRFTSFIDLDPAVPDSWVDLGQDVSTWGGQPIHFPDNDKLNLPERDALMIPPDYNPDNACWRSALIVSSDDYAIRADPNTTSAILGRLPVSRACYVYCETERKSDGEWFYFHEPLAGVEYGWVRGDGFTFEFVTPDPIPEPPPGDGSTQPLPPVPNALIRNLVKLIDSLISVLEGLRDWLI